MLIDNLLFPSILRNCSVPYLEEDRDADLEVPPEDPSDDVFFQASNTKLILHAMIRG